MERFDRHALVAWLASWGARSELLSRVETWASSSLEPSRESSWEVADVYLVLCGLLVQCVEPQVREDRLDALQTVAAALGYRKSDLSSLLSYVLGITERRLRAFAVLGLGLHATADEIKAAHRRLAKTFHPDRTHLIEPNAQARANQMLARLNGARTLLLRPTDEVVLSGEDDIELGSPVFESEDAPTEGYTLLEEELTEIAGEMLSEDLPSEDLLSEDVLSEEFRCDPPPEEDTSEEVRHEVPSIGVSLQDANGGEDDPTVLGPRAEARSGLRGVFGT